VKLDKENFTVQKDGSFENISLEELAEELPDNSPRYVVFSYHYRHPDGRTSFPLIFFYWSPTSMTYD
jgi:hypothetical protein